MWGWRADVRELGEATSCAKVPGIDGIHCHRERAASFRVAWLSRKYSPRFVAPGVCETVRTALSVAMSTPGQWLLSSRIGSVASGERMASTDNDLTNSERENRIRAEQVRSAYNNTAAGMSVTAVAALLVSA